MDFSYLRPPSDVENVVHDPHYIKHGEGKNHVRKIFFNVEYDDYEKQKILEFEELIKKHDVQLPADWCRELTLKYCYSGGFDLTRCLQRLQKHLEWRQDPNFQVLTKEAEEYLVFNTSYYHKQGICYQFGRDLQYRPIVYIQVYQINKLKLNVTTLLCAATHLSKIVQQYMMVRGKVENWIVVLDTGGAGIFDTPFSTLTMINDILSINFTSSLHKMFILNPGMVFSASWRLIEKIIHPETAQKINFVKPKDYHKLQDHIPGDEIEQKYGGSYPNLTIYWPIINTRGQNPNDEFNKLPSKRFLSVQSEYFSLEYNPNEFFGQRDQYQEYTQQNTPCCTCNIM